MSDTDLQAPAVGPHNEVVMDRVSQLLETRPQGPQASLGDRAERKTIMVYEDALLGDMPPLEPGWTRCELTSEGHDQQGRQLMGVIDRQM